MHLRDRLVSIHSRLVYNKQWRIHSKCYYSHCRESNVWNLYWEPKTLDIGPGLSDLLKIVELEEQKHSRKWDTNERSLVVIKTCHWFQSFYKQIVPWWHKCKHSRFSSCESTVIPSCERLFNKGGRDLSPVIDALHYLNFIWISEHWLYKRLESQRIT